jgi:DNA-binding LacI/PurR family transcriptional regulator
MSHIVVDLDPAALSELEPGVVESVALPSVGRAGRRQHLVGLDNLRIAAIDRLTGCRSVMLEAGLADDAVFSHPGGLAAMCTLLDRHPDLDTVVVANDLMARGAAELLAASGRSVPGDVAVIGFDDSPAALSAHLQLTTVRQPSEAMGTRMTDMLLELLGGHRPDSPTILPTELVVRDCA